MQPKVQFKQPPLLFRNHGQGQVRERQRRRRRRVHAARSSRAARPTPTIDRDGDLDVLITTNHGPAYLFRNDGGNANHWLDVRTDGHEVEPRRHRRRRPRAERLGQAVEHGPQRLELLLAERPGPDVRPRPRIRTVTAIEVEWPSGAKETITNVPANQFLTIEEGKGIVAKVPRAGTQ